VGVFRVVTWDKHPAFRIGEEIVSHPERPTRSAFQFWWSETVRWGDMDALRHVNNVAYLQYLESARIGFFEAKGWNSVDIGAAGQGPVVVSQTFNYRRNSIIRPRWKLGSPAPRFGSAVLSCRMGCFDRGLTSSSETEAPSSPGWITRPTRRSRSHRTSARF